ncbi:hypothetical protein L9F63_004096, partial [Diploptera punctata]
LTKQTTEANPIPVIKKLLFAKLGRPSNWSELLYERKRENGMRKLKEFNLVYRWFGLSLMIIDMLRWTLKMYQSIFEVFKLIKRDFLRLRNYNFFNFK